MFKAARLRERNPKLGFGMRTYTSATTGTKYVAGHVGKPSALRVVKDPREVKELQAIAQFEVLDFETAKELYDLLQIEMEQRSRMGQSAVRAEIIAEEGEMEDIEPPPVTSNASRTLDEVAPDEEAGGHPGEDSDEDDGDSDLGEGTGEETGVDFDFDEEETEEAPEEKNHSPIEGAKKGTSKKGKKKPGTGRKIKK